MIESVIYQQYMYCNAHRTRKLVTREHEAFTQLRKKHHILHQLERHVDGIIQSAKIVIYDGCAWESILIGPRDIP